MAKCIVCGNTTTRPVAAAFEHFRLYQSGQWKYLRGNVRQFGRWAGVMGTLGLCFPVFNTLRHWRLRRARLVIPGFTDMSGRPMASAEPCPHGWVPRDACHECTPNQDSGAGPKAPTSDRAAESK